MGRPASRPVVPGGVLGACAALVLPLFAPGAGAQREPQAERVVHAVPRNGARIQVDGRLDEAVWAAAPAAGDFVQRQPVSGGVPSQRTQASVVYDSAAVYVALRLFDDRPDSIAAQLSRRDQAGTYSDWAHVYIDSYHDRRTAFRFSVNPVGVRADAIHFDDTGQEPGWDPVWDAAAAVDSLGWSAEFRIPLSQLRYGAATAEGGGGERVWGINFARQIARRDELAYWSPVPLEGGGFVSRFGTLRGLRGLPAPRRLEVLGYGVATTTRAPGIPGDPFARGSTAGVNAGADVKYGLTSNFTLDATLNPDFGQVEADPAVVNLTAFESFFPERRPFFTEGTDIFQFRIGVGDGDLAGEQLFYSRRIGRAPQRVPQLPGGYVDVPEATTILGAAKVSGKTSGGWSVGFLNAVTAQERARVVDSLGTHGTTAVEPLSNYAVGRVVRDLRRGESAVGAIATAMHRSNPDVLDGLLPREAYAAGVDGRHRFGGRDWLVTGWLLGSRVSGSERAMRRIQTSPAHYFQRPGAGHLGVDTTLTTLPGAAGQVMVSKIGGGHWRAAAGGTARSPGFEVNDLGFSRNSDWMLQVLFVGYDGFRPGRRFRRWNLGVNQSSRWTFGGERTATTLNAVGMVQHLRHWGASAIAQYDLPAYSPFALRGGPLLRTPGRFLLQATVHGDRRRPVAAEVTARLARETDTGRYSPLLQPAVSVRASARADLLLAASLGWNRDPQQFVAAAPAPGGPRYVVGALDQTTASLTVRGSYTFSPTLSLQLYAQPFVSAGRFRALREVRDARAARPGERFHTFAADELRLDPATRQYTAFPETGGAYRFADPAFHSSQFRSNTVLRWEYRPGSALFVAWSQGRTLREAGRPFSLLSDAGHLFEAPSSNVLLIKLSYWLTP